MICANEDTTDFHYHKTMTNTPPPPPRWSLETKRWVFLILALVTLGLIYYARSALSWLAMSALLAYLLQPLVNWLCRHRLPRALAVFISIVLAFGLIIILPLLAMPLLATQFLDTLKGLQDALIQGVQFFNLWLRDAQVIQLWGRQIDISAIINASIQRMGGSPDEIYIPPPQELISYTQKAVQTAGGIISFLSSWVTTIVGRLISLAFSLILMLFYTFYITMDGWKLKPWLMSLTSPAYRPEMEELGSRINRVWQAFFRGQLALSAAVGLVTFLGGLAIGLPNALALGIIAGIFEVVPTLGPVLSAIPAFTLALIQGSSVLSVGHFTFALITLGLYLAIQQLENALLVPKIMGKALELHPMVVLVGVVIGASMAGVLGAFLAAPTMATLKILFGYAHARIQDRDPFPISFEEEEAMALAARGPSLRQRLRLWRARLSAIWARLSKKA